MEEFLKKIRYYARSGGRAAIENNVLNVEPGEVEVLPLELAHGKYNLREYGISDKDFGIFVRIPAEVQALLPIRACFLITRPSFSQRIKNVVVAEEGSKAVMVSGCGSAEYVLRSQHIGETIFHVKEGANLDYLAVHSWSEVEVKSKTKIKVEHDGRINYGYVLLSGKGKTDGEISVELKERSRANIFSSMFVEKDHEALSKTKVEMWSGSAAEVSSRIVCAGGKARVKSTMVGRERCKGYLECSGIIINGEIESTPTVIAMNPEAELFHEASISKIEGEEIYYLMSRGYTEEEARKKIITGFLSLDTGQELQKIVKELIQSVKLGAFGKK